MRRSISTPCTFRPMADNTPKQIGRRAYYKIMIALMVYLVLDKINFASLRISYLHGTSIMSSIHLETKVQTVKSTKVVPFARLETPVLSRLITRRSARVRPSSVWPNTGPTHQRQIPPVRLLSSYRAGSIVMVNKGVSSSPSGCYSFFRPLVMSELTHWQAQ